MSNRRKIVVFTGAGVSAESGIKTFRDYGGLWENFKIEEVASPHGWEKDPQKVLDFYNYRRNEMVKTFPNRGHEIIAELEKDFDVTVITQNVDDLHERAGSTKVYHLHGELNKCRSEYDPTLRYPYDKDLEIGDVAEDGYQLRPHIVWFGEMLDVVLLNLSEKACIQADACIIVGTSMQVYPANQVPFQTRMGTEIIYVDPGEMDFEIPLDRKPCFSHIQEVATTGMVKAKDRIYELHNKNLL